MIKVRVLLNIIFLLFCVAPVLAQGNPVGVASQRAASGQGSSDVSEPLSRPRPVNPAERVISLGPVLTEEIYLLGSADKLIGTTTYCQRPEAARLKERVGSILDINIEKVVSLRPDLVLATVLTDPRAKEKMRHLGLRVVEIPNARDFDGICDVFHMLGQLLGKEKEADLIIADSRNKVQALKEDLKIRQVMVFVQVGVNPLVTIGRGSFLNDLIESAGGVNIVTDSGYLQYSKEKVLESDPDVIFISSMGFDGEREKTNWKRFNALRAVAEDRIFVLDEYLMCSPTPVSFVETLKIIIDYLSRNRTTAGRDSILRLPGRGAGHPGIN